MTARKLTLSILFFIPMLIMAQTHIIVKDSLSNDPLSGVSVLWKGKTLQTITDDKGEFSLKSFKSIEGTDTLIFSSVGYTLLETTIDRIKSSGSIIYLRLKDESLSQVIVTGNAHTQLSMSIPYKELASLPQEISSFGTVIADDKIYIIGGDISINAQTAEESFLDEEYKAASMKGMIGGKIAIQLFRLSDRMYVYDIASDMWSESEHRFSKRSCHNMVYNKGKIYVLGGKLQTKNVKLERLNNKIEVYSILEDTVIVDETNPHQAVNAASVVVDNNIIILGGSVKSSEHGDKVVKGYTNKVHMLDLTDGYWYELPELPANYSEEMKGVVVGNNIYLIGGYKERPLFEISTYDISSGVYKVVGQLPVPIERPALAFDNNQTVYIYDSGRIYTYNIHTGELFSYHIGFDISNAEMLYDKGLLYVLGGKKDNIPSAGLYKVNTSDFEVTKPLDF